MAEQTRRQSPGQSTPAGQAPNPNATGSADPIPGDRPGLPGRETHERDAAYRRGRLQTPLSGTHQPDLSGLRAHRLFMLLAENVRDYAIFLLDRDGIIRFWGEGARLMKWWTSHQAEGAHLRLLYLDGGSEDGTAETHLRTAAERGEYSGEGQRLRSDGSTFWAGVTLTALRDDDGTLVAFTSVTRDLSARRAIEKALAGAEDALESRRIAEEANRLKSLFVGSVSHELRNPLNAMLGYLQLLDRACADEDQRKLIMRIRNNGQHLMQIVDDVLDVTRMDAGRMAIQLGSIRVGPPVEAAYSDAKSAAHAKGVILTNSVSGTAADLSCWGDESRVRQIVTNLLSNAVKFTPAGGHVIVSAGSAQHAHTALSAEGPWIYVRVEDTGEGIGSDRLAMIFEPFEQARLSDVNRGTGLGLAIARRLARLMGGDLTVQSEVGVGSQFVLWLPVAAPSSVPR
jgi:PAS domain S-box-containing protein